MRDVRRRTRRRPGRLEGHRTLIISATTILSLALGFAAAVEGKVASNSRPATTASTTVIVAGAPDSVFALFTPGSRSRWDPEWDIEITTPGEGRRDGSGATFHRADDPGVVWKVTALDAARRVLELAYTRPDRYDMTVRIACSAGDAGHTRVEVTYVAAAHSDYIHDALDSSLAHQIDTIVAGKDGWRDLLNHYLTTGTRFAPFVPVAIERSHTAIFNAPPDRVFAIANPAGGNHWTTHTPEYLFGSIEEPSGAMWRVRDSWYLLADYDADRRSMKTVLFIPEIEFMVEELRCDPAPGGGTTMTVTWRVAGLPPGGNEAVQQFFDRSWDRRMEMLEASYREDLERETRAK